MEILTKIIIILCFVTLLVTTLRKANGLVGRITSQRRQILLRSLLYAVVFTPTAYHHAPNTIIAPLHLPTICGNLFYGYEYTFTMLAYGVLAPVTFGFLAIWITLTFRNQYKNSKSYTTV